MKKSLWALPLLAIVPLAVLVTSKPCACMNPDDLVRQNFHADPYGNSDAFRQALLKEYPPGTPWSLLQQYVSWSRHKECFDSDQAKICTWHFAKNDLGLFTEKFRIEFVLDQQQNLVDVRARRYREWF